MSYFCYDRKEEAKRVVRAERELLRHLTTPTDWMATVPLPPPLTEAELVEARIAVDAEEKQ